MKGMSKSDMAQRRAMLEHNEPMLSKAMKESGLSDPVGIVADARDKMGRKLFKLALLASGKSEQDAEKKIAEMIEQMGRQEQYPTGLLVVSWERAEKLLPLTSPTASANLRKLKPMCQAGTGIYLIVGVGRGGNTYGIVPIDDMPQLSPPQHVADGQHRVTGVYFPKR